MEYAKNLFLLSKFLWTRGSISSKFIDTLALCPPKASTALSYTDWVVPADGMKMYILGHRPG